jgi:hypothetical protein
MPCYAIPNPISFQDNTRTKIENENETKPVIAIGSRYPPHVSIRSSLRTCRGPFAYKTGKKKFVIIHEATKGRSSRDLKNTQRK